jgi:predicted CXXCH cytochrome family protein
MAKKPVAAKKKKTTIPLIVFILAGAALVLGITGFSVGASLEEHDSFCASCHTLPETTFYGRATAKTPVDLASFHTTKAGKCIDCHSGDGVTGRISAEIGGAFNAMHYYTHTYAPPGKLFAPFNDSDCLKCHATVVNQQAAQNNHFHVFLTRWQATDPNAGRCTNCHPAHTNDSPADNGFMNDQRTQQVCDACHQVLGRGGG